MLNAFLKNFIVTDAVSRELSLHPVHLTPDKEGKLPPSALIPFCSYQGDSNLLGQERPELDNLTVCDKFEPTILEGQLCYSLDIAKLGKKPTKSDKSNGLFLLLDPNPYQLNAVMGSKTEEQSCNKQLHLAFLHVSMWPPTTSRILEPPDCLPGLF